MNILVISHSTIVIELLKFVFKKNSINSEHSKSIESVNSDSYSIIFIDDSTQNYENQLQEIVDNFSYNKLVFIGNANKRVQDIVDTVIKKPFLPKDIKEIIDSTNTQKPKTKVLDADEIARIKALMDLDIEDEDDKRAIDKLRDKETLTLKKKEAKEFLIDCTNLDKKELKKLLKGAKVSIKIKYKSSNNE